MLASAAAHVALVVALCLYAPPLPELPPLPPPFARVALVAPPKAADLPPLPRRKLPKRAQRADAPRPAMPQPPREAAPELEAPRLETEAAPTLDLAPEQPKLAAPEPQTRPTLGDVVAAAPEPPKVKPVREAGFEGAPLQASGPSREARLQVGAFQGLSGAPGGASTVQVREGAFAGSQASRAAGKPGPAVGTGGFGRASTTSTQASRPTTTSAGFGEVQAERAEARSAEKRADPSTTPVEVLSKPKPVYTTEARELRIEGEVVLEARFAAAGEVEVLRVVHGLGHGLDEAAAEAVRAMQFRPATRAGALVDSVLRVSVAFHLAY
jgi:TonB family protein